MNTEALNKLTDYLNNSTDQRVSLSFEEIEKVGDRDAWFTAQEALDFGLIDEIIRKKI